MIKIKFASAVVGLVLITSIIFFITQTPNNLKTNQIEKIDVLPISNVSSGLSDENLTIAEKIDLPLSGSAPETNTKHLIPIEEIRRGCFKQDCIPSIDDPEFSTASELTTILKPESIGIALSYKGEQRFYPFPMLETHELVNDFVSGDPLLISYCPLCGTGIVFERTLNGEVLEFGVSGMLWQSNLLMYNRSEKLEDRNLWSQVLATAVVGNRAGEKLTIVPSDIVKFSDWLAKFPNELVLNSGQPQDPYSGQYYQVATNFNPNFDPTTAAIAPDTYVYGIVVGEQPVAIIRDTLPQGVSTFDVVGTEIIVSAGDTVTFTDKSGNQISDIEGFWFSWQSAHPDTIVITNI